MPALVHIKVSEDLCLRDPEETKLGRTIIEQGIEMLDTEGYDALTFKKLAARINSTEASIYRYYQSKKQLLEYLLSWYWNWLEYQIDIKTTNLRDPEDKLDVIIEVLIKHDKTDAAMAHIDVDRLYRIVITESARVYLTKQQDSAREREIFHGYEKLCYHIADVLKEINSGYPFLAPLASTLVSGIHKQIFIQGYTPAFGKPRVSEKDRREIHNFAKQLVVSALHGPVKVPAAG
jgi:AcrR family transcriptional regulator